jgi:hypothetical protein
MDEHCTLTALDKTLLRHFGSPEFAARVPELMAAFKSDGYVEIADFVPTDVLAQVQDELRGMFAEQGRRRELHIASTGNTPRYYSNLDRDALDEGSEVVPAVFRCRTLFARLSEIAGQDVVPVPYRPEEYISSLLDRPGDVHGWHWDDYTFALVWLIQASPRELGGSLEYVRDTRWDKDDPKIDYYLANYPVERRHPTTGTAYLLKSDTAMHRVAPVKEGANRIMVCFTYCSLDDLDRSVSHETMEELYPEATANT